MTGIELSTIICESFCCSHDDFATCFVCSHDDFATCFVFLHDLAYDMYILGLDTLETGD